MTRLGGYDKVFFVLSVMTTMFLASMMTCLDRVKSNINISKMLLVPM